MGDLTIPYTYNGEPATINVEAISYIPATYNHSDGWSYIWWLEDEGGNKIPIDMCSEEETRITDTIDSFLNKEREEAMTEKAISEWEARQLYDNNHDHF